MLANRVFPAGVNQGFRAGPQTFGVKPTHLSLASKKALAKGLCLILRAVI